MNKEGVVRSVWRAVEPHLTEQGYTLVEAEYDHGQAQRNVLRLYIDKAGGVTLDDCTAVSQLLGPMLDAEDLVAGNYVLEVSSPGIERPVRKASDFERFAGEEIRLVTHAPVADGRKRFNGVLTGFKDGLIGVECDGKHYEVHIENLKKANLSFRGSL